MRTPPLATGLLCLGLALLLARVATAQDRPIVAVFDLEVKGTRLDKGAIDRLTDYLGSLLGSRGYRVVPRSQLRARLTAEKKGSYQECYDQGCQIEIGKELAAQKSVSSQVLKIGKKCKVTVNLFDLKTAASDGSGTSTGTCDEDGVVVALEQAVEGMLGKAAPGEAGPGRSPQGAGLSDYERLAAQAEADAARRLELEKKLQAEKLAYLDSLEKAWDAVRRIVLNPGLARPARAEVLKKFLADFPRDNPREAAARDALAKLEHGEEPGSLGGMVLVPAGEYTMGCSVGELRCDHDTKPRHTVWVSDLWLDATEVTVAAFKQCVDEGKCQAPVSGGPSDWRIEGKEQLPVDGVTWSEARAFCEWAGKRLPTEAEWEKAARAGTAGVTYGPLDQVAWFSDNSGGATHPVGQKQPNALGLYDMLGNREEYCEDWYTKGPYPVSPAWDPAGPQGGEGRVQRGGHWNHAANNGWTSMRDFRTVDARGGGFRCARSAGPRAEPASLARAEPARYRAFLEKVWAEAWSAAGDLLLPRPDRAARVRAFLQAFPVDNPRAAEARSLLAALDKDQDPIFEQPPAPGLSAEVKGGMARIPAGEFVMGCVPWKIEAATCGDSDLAHAVWLSEYWMDVTEVTVAAYRRCVDAGRCRAPDPNPSCSWGQPDQEQHPMGCVDWERARAYCEWAGKRLPTEAEWEKAAQGGLADLSWGRGWGLPDKVAWYGANAGGATQLVGKKLANAYGLFDMLGNVWEWCADWYGEGTYQASPARDPQGPDKGEKRLARGGSANEPAGFISRITRLQLEPEFFGPTFGFRCVRSAAP
jgi:formylglycine-generating enzyme required for sulfatase activity